MICVSSSIRTMTFVGRVEREQLDFLGYHFSPEGLSVAAATLRQFENRVSRLYEQDSTGKRVRDYVKRFQLWIRSGLSEVAIDVDLLKWLPQTPASRPSMALGLE